ncbi:hypothetical protein BGW38_004852 [Lunasporangiospora selenospora]|uniref:Uncharacterized protein n=1 Tax=Lunasporangiospora selenospora TaxID=979761 RepID=A0A9P6FP61_9FUNG|nr:hypothetical protein BGW38_004852 [Lunasporangiospora selenospora]
MDEHVRDGKNCQESVPLEILRWIQQRTALNKEISMPLFAEEFKYYLSEDAHHAFLNALNCTAVSQSLSIALGDKYYAWQRNQGDAFWASRSANSGKLIRVILIAPHNHRRRVACPSTDSTSLPRVPSASPGAPGTSVESILPPGSPGASTESISLSGSVTSSTDSTNSTSLPGAADLSFKSAFPSTVAPGSAATIGGPSTAPLNPGKIGTSDTVAAPVAPSSDDTLGILNSEEQTILLAQIENVTHVCAGACSTCLFKIYQQRNVEALAGSQLRITDIADVVSLIGDGYGGCHESS